MIEKHDPDEIQGYLEDPSNLKGKAPEQVFLPENTQQVSDLLKQARAGSIPVTISAGGTGVVGGRIPLGGWVLSTEKLNKIHSIDTDAKRAALQAGVIVDTFLEELKTAGLFYPPFPTEKTAFIGGTAATNASGEYTYRFGCTRKYVECLTMVLADGTPVDVQRGENILKGGTVRVPGYSGEVTTGFRSPDLPKNSCGYHIRDDSDLIDLFIGSEGTLGVITELEVSVIPDLREPLFCVVFLTEPKGFDMAQEFKQSALADSLLCLEYFDANSLSLLGRHTPVPAGMSEALLVVLAVDDEEALWDQLEALLEKPYVGDTWASDSEATRKKIYEFRKALPEAVNEKVKEKGILKLSTDIAVPEPKAAEMFAFYRQELEKTDLEYAVFGHIGESHLHINLLPEPDKAPLAEELYIRFLRRAVSLGGTIAAEHGLGKKKATYLPLMYSAEQISEMKKVKDFLDPSGILSPGNIFP